MLGNRSMFLYQDSSGWCHLEANRFWTLVTCLTAKRTAWRSVAWNIFSNAWRGGGDRWVKLKGSKEYSIWSSIKLLKEGQGGGWADRWLRHTSWIRELNGSLNNIVIKCFYSLGAWGLQCGPKRSASANPARLVLCFSKQYYLIQYLVDQQQEKRTQGPGWR